MVLYGTYPVSFGNIQFILICGFNYGEAFR